MDIYGLGGYSRSSRILLCMVGLPARGKSYITRMITRYLGWSGFPAKTFNAGELRRQEGMAGISANFFSSEDKEASAVRERLASKVMEEAIDWLNKQTSVCVAIFDATNTTKKRRRMILDTCREATGITPVFVESICNDESILLANYKLKCGNDDYQTMDPAAARADFLERIKAYEKRYETVEDDEGEGKIRYIKLFNVGQKVVMHRCAGYLMSQVGFYLSNIHVKPRSIWLTRHAESEEQRKGILGSCSGELTRRGRQYCKEMAAFLQRQRKVMLDGGEDEGAEILVLMGTVPMHAATLRAVAQGNPDAGLGLSAMSSSLLNELDSGDFHGMSYERVAREYPELWQERENDKLNFRWPGSGGESYSDVIGRLHPIIIELERQRHSVLVISHLAVQRCLYAYFTGCPSEELPHLDMPMHTTFELRPGPFGCAVDQFCLDPAGPPSEAAR